MEQLSPARTSSRRGSAWRRVPQPALFLRLEIDRDLTVRREPSFAYPVLTDFFPVGEALPFVAAFLDGDGRSLSCATLRADYWYRDPGCWPKQVRQTLSFPSGARTFQVLADRQVIHEEAIPDPPTLELECGYAADAERIRVKWHAAVPAKHGERRERPATLWYLVQYHSRDAWRGIGPRTQETEAYIEFKHMGLPVSVPIRVLATSGIATGMAECAQEEDKRDTGPEGELVLATPEPQDEPVQVGSLLRVHAIDSGGRSLPQARVRWYDEAGRELTRGRDLDVGALGPGEHVVHAVATGTGGRPLVRTFVLHRQEPHAPCYLVASTALPPRADSPVHRHEQGEMHDH
jgi:hypothetical protein